MDVCCVCPEESSRLWRVVVCVIKKPRGREGRSPRWAAVPEMMMMMMMMIIIIIIIITEIYFTKILPMGAGLFHVKGQTDRQTDMTQILVARRSFRTCLKTSYLLAYLLTYYMDHIHS
jgi:hypothetical protein